MGLAVVARDVGVRYDLRLTQRRTLKQTLTDTVLRIRADYEADPTFWALDGVTFVAEQGDVIGIVGRNGAGKSSTLRALAGIVPLDAGRAECGGRVVTLLELGAGFGRDFDGRENILLNGALHGMTRAEIEQRMDAIVAFSELGEFIDVPVKTYSSGMFVRLGFAIAAHIPADVMLIDEVLAVGDEAFQRKCEQRIAERVQEGATLVLVSHDAALVERTCERVVVLDGGAVAFDGPAADGMAHYHEMMGTVTA
jgi:lipopolysaccharide transport system ATP-binding protein